MTKKLTKKLISIFLSLMMVLSLIPMGSMTAFAALHEDATCSSNPLTAHYHITGYDEGTGKYDCTIYQTNGTSSSFKDTLSSYNVEVGKWYIQSGPYLVECNGHGDSTPEWVDTIISKADAVSEDLYSEAWGATLKEYFGMIDFDSLDSLVNDMDAPEYSQEGSVYTIEGVTSYGKFTVTITLDEDENIASVAINYAGAYTATFTPAPAGPKTCGRCANCGHAESDHEENECSTCTTGACKDENKFVACVLEKDHKGKHSATLPPCGLCVVCGHAKDKHDGACADCHGTKGNCRDKDNFVACALDKGHDGDHSLGTVEAPEWADDIMGKIDTVAEFCVYNFYGGSMTLADLMMNKPLAELLADVSDEVLYKQEGNYYYIYGIDSTNVYMFRAEVNENGDIIYISFAQTIQGSTERVDFVAPIPGTPCGKCVICGHKQSDHRYSSCVACYENNNISLSMHEHKACVLDVIHKGDHSDTLPPCGKCVNCGHAGHGTGMSASMCQECYQAHGACINSGVFDAKVCVLSQGHTGPCSAHTHNSSAYGTSATQHWTKCTDDNDNNGTPANHTWSNGQCSVCNYTCQHSGGTATCTAAAVCSTCGASYGSALGHTYATTWSSDENQHWYAATCEHNTLKKDTANHTYGTEGTARYTCTVCSAVNEAKKLQIAKAEAKAAIDEYLGESDNADAIAVANKAKQDIDAATNGDEVNSIKNTALEDIKDIIAPDFATLRKDLKAANGELKLTKDYTRVSGQGDIFVDEGQKIVIDLNGHTIDGAKDERYIQGCIFYVSSGGELVINDSTDNEGVITGGIGYYDNDNSIRWGGVIDSYGTVTINGGTFTGNTANYGGVISNVGTVTINGGVFTNNSATSRGGVVDNVGDNCVVVITGGTFTGNKAKYGGVVENYRSESCTITGGTFTGNTATGNGGAIENDSSTLYIGGSPVIKDNKVGDNTNNVEVYGATIVLADTALTEDAEIGITINKNAKTDTIIAEGATLDTLKALKSDDATKMFIVDNGAVKIMNIADHVHAGGTATCLVLKTCQSCGASYGDYADHVYGTTGASRYTCTVCQAVDNDKKSAADLADAKNSAAAAIITAVGSCEEANVIKVANDYLTAIESAETVAQVNKLKADGVKAVNDAKHKHSYKKTVVKAATYNAAGKAQYTCSCGDTYSQVIPKLTITSAVKYNNSTKMDASFKVTTSQKDVTVKWGKVADADGYIVYASYCGKDYKAIKTIKGSATTSYTFTKLDGKKLNLNKNIKVYVVAYKTINGKKAEFGKTISGHVVGGWSRTYTNPTKVTVKNSTVTLAKGKTSKISATVTYKYAGKKHLSEKHIASKRYRSSNKAVATVDSKGNIKAVGKGTCTIYVFAANGASTKVTVTVK